MEGSLDEEEGNQAVEEERKREGTKQRKHGIKLESRGSATKFSTVDSVSFVEAGWVDGINTVMGGSVLVCRVKSGTRAMGIRFMRAIRVVGSMGNPTEWG